MTNEQKIQQRIDRTVLRIETGKLKWKADIKGPKGKLYAVPEQATKEAFIALLRPIITEIVNAEG